MVESARGLEVFIRWQELYPGRDTPPPDTRLAAWAIQVNEDGSVTVFTGTVEMGQGSETAMAAIVTRALGISVDQASVLGVDTDVVPYDLTTSSSRSSMRTIALGS